MIAILFVEGLFIASVKALFTIALLDGIVRDDIGDPTRLPRAIARWRWRLP